MIFQELTLSVWQQRRFPAETVDFTAFIVKLLIQLLLSFFRAGFLVLGFGFFFRNHFEYFC